MHPRKALDTVQTIQHMFTIFFQLYNLNPIHANKTRKLMITIVFSTLKHTHTHARV